MCIFDSFFPGLDIRIPQALKKSLVISRFCQGLLMLLETAIKVGTGTFAVLTEYFFQFIKCLTTVCEAITQRLNFLIEFTKALSLQ